MAGAARLCNLPSGRFRSAAIAGEPAAALRQRIGAVQEVEGRGLRVVHAGAALAGDIGDGGARSRPAVQPHRPGPASQGRQRQPRRVAAIDDQFGRGARMLRLRLRHRFDQIGRPLIGDAARRTDQGHRHAALGRRRQGGAEMRKLVNDDAGPVHAPQHPARAALRQHEIDLARRAAYPHRHGRSGDVDLSDQAPQFPLTQAAMQRLEAAVARLEAALAVGAPGDLVLAEELRLARADYDALQSVTRAVSGRLDDAIGRLKTVLEG